MARRYRDSVEVQTRLVSAGSTDSVDAVVDPSAFVWQGRLYVVREVLDHWRERRDWWRDVSDAPEGSAVGALTEVTQLEQDVWRVEASAGRRQGSGVYDLVRRGGRAPEHQWRLVRVAD